MIFLFINIWMQVDAFCALLPMNQTKRMFQKKFLTC